MLGWAAHIPSGTTFYNTDRECTRSQKENSVVLQQSALMGPPGFGLCNNRKCWVTLPLEKVGPWQASQRTAQTYSIHSGLLTHLKLTFSLSLPCLRLSLSPNWLFSCSKHKPLSSVSEAELNRQVPLQTRGNFHLHRRGGPRANFFAKSPAWVLRSVNWEGGTRPVGSGNRWKHT